jgi:hypothetical protein
MLKTLLIGALMLAPGSAASAREPSVHQLPSHGIVSAVDTPRLPWQAPVGHRQQRADAERAEQTGERSAGNSHSTFDWLDLALDRKVLICRGC